MTFTSDADVAASNPGTSFGDHVSDALVAILRDTGIGHRLPSERILAKKLGVSRTMLRDRSGVLESLGLLRRRTGSGTYVHGLDAELLGRALNVGLLLADPTTDSLLDVRIALERQAAKQAALRQDHVAIGHLRVALEAILDAPNPQMQEQADFDFHRALLHSAGNPSLQFFSDSLERALRRSFAQRRVVLDDLPNHDDLMRRLHREIFVAIQSGDAEYAMRAVDQHFDAFALATEHRHR